MIDSGGEDVECLGVELGKKERYMGRGVKLVWLMGEMGEVLEEEEMRMRVGREICGYGEDIQKEV